MRKIFVDPKELQAASVIANSAEILSCRLTKSTIAVTVPFGTDFNTLVFCHYRWRHEPFAVPVPGCLLANVALDAMISSEKIDGDIDAASFEAAVAKSSAHITMQYELKFSIPSEPVPEEIEKLGGLAAFAKWNALYTSWPYFRQELDRLCGAALLPRVQLPLIKLIPKPAVEEK